MKTVVSIAGLLVGMMVLAGCSSLKPLTTMNLMNCGDSGMDLVWKVAALGRCAGGRRDFEVENQLE